MAFSRIYPAGVPANSSLTSAAVQQLDIDHANAAHSDNTTDTIASQWTFSSTARWTCQSGFIGTFQAGSTATFQGVVNLTGTTMVVGDGTNPYTFAVTSASTFQTNSGSTFLLANGTTATAKTPIILSTAGGGTGKVTTSGGGIVELANNDWPTFAGGHSGKTPKRRLPFANLQVASPFALASSGLGMTGNASATPGRFQLPLGPAVWNGLVVSSINLIFTPVGGHGGLPANNIQATLKYYTPNIGGAVSLGTIGSTATYTPVSLSDYNNGNAKQLALNPGTPTIDATANCYVLEVIDENGANALTGNVFHAVEFNFTAVDARPS